MAKRNDPTDIQRTRVPLSALTSRTLRPPKARSAKKSAQKTVMSKTHRTHTRPDGSTVRTSRLFPPHNQHFDASHGGRKPE